MEKLTSTPGLETCWDHGQYYKNMWMPTSEREGQKIIVTYRDIPHNYIVTTKMEMEWIRQTAIEQGVDLQVQGLACLPRELKKYTSSIVRYQRRGGGFLYVACIQHKDLKSNATFETLAKADQYIRDFNVREGLPIRNRFVLYEDRVEVELSKGKTLICNIDDLYLVELHIWYYTCSYVATCISLHQLQHYKALFS